MRWPLFLLMPVLSLPAHAKTRTAIVVMQQDGPSATVDAKVREHHGQPDKAVMFGYDTGATMDYEAIAPARRVIVLLGNDGFANLSPVGPRLFDAAIDWAISQECTSQ